MTTLTQRIKAFEALRGRLQSLSVEELDEWYWRAQNNNAWFTPKYIQRAIDGFIQYLEPQAFQQWLNQYAIPEERNAVKTVGVIMAGNIPMVGIHDFLTVLISGHHLRAKLSSQDPYLLKEIGKMLVALEPAMEGAFVFEDRMNKVDALIATGSDNSARYFQYYFKHVPHIIRQNRTSVAVITGNETKEELEALADDICTYFGLGCRNVSKIYAPEGYSFIPLLDAMEQRAGENMENHKYANNYDYNKSIMLVNNVKHLDTGALMITESEALVSPISVVHYEYYKNSFSLEATLMGLSDKIQCIVGQEGSVGQALPFGQAQHPNVADYADGVDTMEFLLKF